MAIDFTLPPDVVRVRERVRDFMRNEVAPAEARFASEGGRRSASQPASSVAAGTSCVRARSQRSVQPRTWRARKPSGLPRASRPTRFGSTAWNSTSVSISTSDSLRLAPGSRPPPNSGGTTPRTTTPRRRSMTKKGAPMTDGSSQ